MAYDEQKIIEGLKKGDNQAYKYLYDHHYVLLCKIAATFLSDRYLAQSLVDSTIIHVYENRETLFITTSLRAYLVRSVRNRCISHLRQENVRKEFNFSAVNISDDWLFSIAAKNDFPLAILLENELENEISLAIQRLPNESRIVFEMSRFEGKDYETIAKELNISINTVKYHIKNALSRLHKDLDKYLLLILSLLNIFFK